MCNLCCPVPQKNCWNCKAKRPTNLSPCKYCYSVPCNFKVSTDLEFPPPPPPLPL